MMKIYVNKIISDKTLNGEDLKNISGENGEKNSLVPNEISSESKLNLF